MGNNTFRKFVIIFVTLIGTGFGTWAGFTYYQYEKLFWIGTLVGLVSSFGLAKLYLGLLGKISAKGYKKFIVWLLGTLIAVLCGIVCTTLVHGIMIATILISTAQSLHSLDVKYEGFLGVVIVGAEMIGAVAGFIAGVICSSMYVIKIMGKADEAINPA
jgi:hypothetical protein